MTTAIQATAAAVPITIAGKTYEVSPLADRDWAELDLWYQGRMVRIARASVAEGASPAEQQAVVADAYARAVGLSFLQDIGKLLQGADGFAVFAWHLLRGRHPDLTPETIRQLALDHPEETVREVMDGWGLLNSRSGNSPAEGDDGKKKDSTPP